MREFHKRLGKITKLSLNQKDFFVNNNIDINKQQQRKKILQLKRLQDKKYFLKKDFQKLIKKFNNNLIMLQKIIIQNNNISEKLNVHSKIKSKTTQFKLLVDSLNRIKQLIIYTDDIDDDVIQNIANKG